MRIVHLATTLHDGAGIAAWRQHEALRLLGVDSRFLVLQPPPMPRDDVASLALPALRTPARAARAVGRVWSRARRWERTRARIDAAVPPRYEAFSLPFSAYRPEAHPWVAAADAVHLHWTSGLLDYPSFFAGLRRPVVWTLHDQNPYLGGFHYETDAALSPQLADLDARCLALKRGSLQGARHTVVGNSVWNTRAAAAAAVFPAGTRFATAYYPLDAARYLPRDRRHAQAALGIPPGRFVIGFASTDLTNPRKGLSDLLAALAEFLRDGAPAAVTLLSFGRAPAESARAALAADWLHLGYLHADEVKAAAYSAMDVFVAPSRAEAFGQTVIEASACGTPVIGTAVGGITEALAPELRSFACPPGQPAALAAALRTLGADAGLRGSLAAAGRRHVAAQHDPHAIARQFLEIYRDAAQPDRRDVSAASSRTAEGNSPRFLAYCWPDMLRQQPGLGHMKEIARVLLIEASLAKRTAVLPPLLSNPFHNLGRTGPLRWSDFFDWSAFNHLAADWRRPDDLARFCRRQRSCLVATAASVETIAAADADLVVRFFPNADIFGQWISALDARSPAALLEPAFSRCFPASIRAEAERVVAEIGAPSGVLQVRRADLACPDSDVPAVARLLHAKHARPDDRILILTDDRDPTFGPRLRGQFPRAVIEHEIGHLQQLRNGGMDNYGIFRIGRCVQADFDRLGLGLLRVVPPGGPSRQRAPWSRRAVRAASRLFLPSDLLSAERIARDAGSALERFPSPALVST